MVRFTWIGETLRLDALTKRLELVPTSEGISAVFSEDGNETKRNAVNLEKDNAEALAKRWLALA
jgi:hypothetical protein